MPVGNLFQRFIAEEVVHPSRQRTPCHQACAVLLHQLTHFYLLGKNVRLQLHYGRLYFHIFSQIHETGIVEIAQSDSTRLSCLVCLFHGTISSVVITKWLVDKQQVDVVRLQFAKRLVDASCRFLFTRVAYPNFGSQEQFLSWNAASADGFAHAFLIIISLRRINRAIPGFQGFRYILLTFRGSNLPNAVTHQRHFDAVV